MLINNIGVTSFQKKEIPAFIIQGQLLPRMDAVRIQDDITLPRLPEYFLQHHHWELLTVHDILQYLSRSYRRELIDVSHQDQPGSHHHRL